MPDKMRWEEEFDYEFQDMLITSNTGVGLKNFIRTILAERNKEFVADLKLSRSQMNHYRHTTTWIDELIRKWEGK